MAQHVYLMCTLRDILASPALLLERGQCTRKNTYCWAKPSKNIAYGLSSWDREKRYKNWRNWTLRERIIREKKYISSMRVFNVITRFYCISVIPSMNGCLITRCSLISYSVKPTLNTARHASVVRQSYLAALKKKKKTLIGN